ncbi:hypothetical protein GCM10010174_13410 [Kutzneria viridogrisea]|uniref:Carrier domain-containing protein n=2 Tax=Kutzneria TaxID=43356 RepID=W5WSB1_9PSEU|nr:phosphopantetheine-binding protein [Kutzneria albida]AHI01055.1 hypothetical protein KALB_7697 [Kutzneria albida DSM 43870]MBA8926310.1 aryl carrier-like protein [Kutzneria viridogrisea]
MAVTEASARADVAELLYLEPGELDDGLNLFDAGLDSVRMLTLVERWREHGVEVSFVDLAEHPTFGQWWALLSDA